MSDLFVPYEQTLELIELGFDEECLAFYNGKFIQSSEYDFDDNTSKDIGKCIKAPLKIQAFKFFREKYNMQGEIYPLTNNWLFQIHCLDEENRGSCYTGFPDIEYLKYEDGELRCLKQMIKIVKDGRTI